jgi:peptide/nickel transport system ATP-binding protein
VPSPTNLPAGCIFEPRCSYVRERCREQHPGFREFGRNHLARCHFAEEIVASEWRPPESLPVELKLGQVKKLEGNPILSVERVKTYYRQEAGSVRSLFGLGEKLFVKAVDDITFEVPKGVTLGVVGESGCGKSTLAKTIVGLEPLTDGRVEFLGFDISQPVKKRDLDLIRELQMIFQNPDSTMNPSFTVGHQIGRPLRRFKTVPSKKVREEVIRLLDSVKLDASYIYRLPRQLSGGEKQRVGIARAFAGRPDLVLCDEPVSSLDVSVQASVLNLLMAIQQEFGTTLIFIAHDLSVVRFFSDFVAVMYLGKICEIGPAEAIYAPPYHP